MSSSPASQLARIGWADLSPAERAERTRPAREAHRRKALERFVDQVVAKAPELSPEQRDVISAALAGGEHR